MECRREIVAPMEPTPQGATATNLAKNLAAASGASEKSDQPSEDKLPHEIKSIDNKQTGMHLIHYWIRIECVNSNNTVAVPVNKARNVI
jgi:hypothetical protein